MALDDAQNSDVVFGQPSGAAALAPAKKDDTVKPTPEAAKPIDVLGQLQQLPKIAEDTGKRIQALELEKMQLNPPKIEKPPKPEFKQDPLSEWGRVAMTLAGLFAGHGARQSLTASLNAAAAGIKGAKEGNKEAVDEAYKKWEVETRNAENMMHFQTDAYKTALANITNREEAVRIMGTDKENAIKASVLATATALQDAGTLQALKHGGLPEAVEYQQKVKDQETNFKERALKIQEMRAENTAGGMANAAYNSWKLTDEGQNATEQQDINKRAEIADQFGVTKNGKAVQFQALRPEQQEKLAEEYLDLKEKIPSANVRARQPGLEDAVQRAYSLAKARGLELSGADYDLMKAAEKDALTGKTAQTMKSLYVGARHLDNLQKLADQLPNEGGIQLQNKFTAGISKQFGAPEVTNFETAKEFIGKELVKAITGAGGGVEERKRMGELFSTAETKEQLAGAIKTARDLMSQQYIGVEHQFASLPEAFQKRFFPEDTKKFYEGAKSEREGASKLGEVKTPEQGARYGAPRNGKTEPIIVKNGKWVYESDGASVQ